MDLDPFQTGGLYIADSAMLARVRAYSVISVWLDVYIIYTAWLDPRATSQVSPQYRAVLDNVCAISPAHIKMFLIKHRWNVYEGAMI